MNDTGLVAEIHLHSSHISKSASQCLSLVLMSAIGEQHLILTRCSTGFYQSLTKS